MRIVGLWSKIVDKQQIDVDVHNRLHNLNLYSEI